VVHESTWSNLTHRWVGLVTILLTFFLLKWASCLNRRVKVGLSCVGSLNPFFKNHFIFFLNVVIKIGVGKMVYNIWIYQYWFFILFPYFLCVFFSTFFKKIRSANPPTHGGLISGYVVLRKTQVSYWLEIRPP